jgi:hypothetical protein
MVILRETTVLTNAEWMLQVRGIDIDKLYEACVQMEAFRVDFKKTSAKMLKKLERYERKVLKRRKLDSAPHGLLETSS